MKVHRNGTRDLEGWERIKKLISNLTQDQILFGDHLMMFRFPTLLNNIRHDLFECQFVLLFFFFIVQVRVVEVVSGDVIFGCLTRSHSADDAVD